MDLEEDSENEMYGITVQLLVWADSRENAVQKAKAQLDRLPIDSLIIEEPEEKTYVVRRSSRD